MTIGEFFVEWVLFAFDVVRVQEIGIEIAYNIDFKLIDWPKEARVNKNDSRKKSLILSCPNQTFHIN